MRQDNASLKHLLQFILQGLIDEAQQLVAVHGAVPQPACPHHPSHLLLWLMGCHRSHQLVFPRLHALHTGTATSRPRKRSLA